MDVRTTPAWRKAIGLAHEVCAALETARDLPGDAGPRLRRAALAIPSLFADAFLDTDARTCHERLADAATQVSELTQLLGTPELRKYVPGPEADVLLSEAESLAIEIRALGGKCPEA